MPDLSLPRLHRTFMRHVFSRWVNPRRDRVPEVARLGTEYGGWWVPIAALNPDSIVYSFGIGEDASFDTALAAAVGCRIHAFDPTPRAIAYVDALGDGRIDFHPYGIWTEDTTIKLFAPADPSHVSLSAFDRFHTGTALELPVRTLTSIMEGLGHDHIDLLKMDIEGAEAPVVEQMLDLRVFPTILAMELERIESPIRTRARIRRLESIGYQIAAVEYTNLTLVRTTLS